jgi:hypothetical protein
MPRGTFSVNEMRLLKQARYKPAPLEVRLIPTIFHEPWWMEIACDGAYREATVSKDGIMIGRLPYLHTSNFPGITSLRMPQLAHVLGPALAPEPDGRNLPRSPKQLSITRELSITRDLISQLPEAAHISFRLHGGMTNTLAFAEAGFTTTVDFTVEVAPDDPDVLWHQMRDKTRNVIRRAQERLTVFEQLDPEAFLGFYEDNLRNKKLDNAYNRASCSAVLKECIRRGVGRILTATDPQGNLQAAIFTVWDHRTEYYLMSTRTPDSMNGATNLLMWTAIQHAARKQLTFDMDMIHVKNNHLPNLLLLTGFGGTMKPRYLVRRTAPVIQLAQDIKRILA